MTHEKLVREMHRRINADGLTAVNTLYPGTTWQKFFDPIPFVWYAADHAMRFQEMWGGPGCPEKKKCADIGCGFGYTALALECLGHDCLAWDNDAPILRAVATCIPVRERNFQTIFRNEPAELMQTYDLIFMHGVFPMRDANGWWKWADYEALCRKLIAALNPGGNLEIIVNRGDELDMICTGATASGMSVNDNVLTWEAECPVAF